MAYIDCKKCKFCEVDADLGSATCDKGRELKISTETIDCDCDGRKPRGGSFEVLKNVWPIGDDCEIGEE